MTVDADSWAREIADLIAEDEGMRSVVLDLLRSLLEALPSEAAALEES